MERVELIGDFLEGGLQGAYLVYRQHGGVLRQVPFRRRQRHRHSIQRLRERQLLPNTFLISGRAFFRLQGKNYRYTYILRTAQIEPKKTAVLELENQEPPRREIQN